MSFNVIQCPVKAGAKDRPASIIDALAQAMSARDGFTHEHARRVQRYAVALAAEANILDPRMLEAIDAAALLHDIGKLRQASDRDSAGAASPRALGPRRLARVI
jgi:response regulator RpfG family c-di-GMP phosphodiesterase